MLLLLPFALYLFRRSALLGAFLIFGFLPQQNAFAVELPSLLKNTDQRAFDAYQSKDYESASSAQSSQLKGAAFYKQGDYDAAVNQFSNDKSATGLYNYANALARAGKLEESLQAYKQALSLQSDFKEAAENQTLVEQLINQQQDEKNGDTQNDQEKNDQENQQQNDDKTKQDQQSENGEKSESKDSENPQGDKSNQDAQQSQEQQEQSNKQNEPDMQAEQQNNQRQNKDADKPEGDAQKADTPNTINEQPASDEQKQNAQQQAMQAQPSELTNEEKEKAQQLNQLLRKVSDDPAILLRNKMQLEAQKRQYKRRPAGVEKSW